MFYHDHALGLTRLNVYAGEAAGYLLNDASEENSLAAAGVPGTLGTVPDLAHLIPLVIQDKTFVYDNSVTPVGVVKDASTFTAVTDPLWDSVNWGTGGNLWFPHVYIPNQDPTSLSGANSLGRWDYGPWFWPVFPVASPYPPTVSHVPEAFMDTPIVNGTPYPYVNVAAAKYRLRILNATNDRMLNLQLYQAD
jgi:FtsP/CotA-like multicopper oxidase with cupredoxin domain